MKGQYTDKFKNTLLA